MRQDPDWLVKTLLGSVISMVPILNFAATGYSLDVVRNVYMGRETPLPEWGENFGERLVRGLIGSVISFIYLLPAVVVICILQFMTVAAGAAAGSDEGGGATATLLALCLIPLIFGALLGLAPLALIAQTRYAISNNFGDAMRIGEVIAEFRAGLKRWVGIFAMLFGVGIAFAVAVMFTCGLGILFAFYVTLVMSHWMAQAYRQSAGGLRPAIGVS